MRIIIFGVGAVGGVVAAALALSGHEVLGIARGGRLEAIRDRGLLLRGHDGEQRVRLEMVGHASEISPGPEDVILLAMKTQHTISALEDLRAAGIREQPIFCMQNGVANESMALRVFPNVHGINVMLPAEYMQADEAICFGRPNLGVFDIGRFPSGCDAADEALAEALTAARIKSFATPTVMENKYGKLIVNLGNIVEALLGRGVKSPIPAALRAEGMAVMEAAGIVWQDMGAGDPRRGTLLTIEPVAGVDRLGNSTAQSLLRGAGSVETDYLNGEIALIARMNGGEAPLNARVAALAAKVAREGMGQVMRPEDLAAAIGL
ncbi:ketopantoate reductase family protein [Antarctobacter jejuensis]|uniref:ketopantoate reductase family protein n=1 Tax=Antarctobacter jejuensis TaxID=1439938 RepID=UPI003FD1FD3F